MFDAHGAQTVLELLPPASVTADANGTGVDMKNYVGQAKVILHCGAATAGTNPPLDVQLQESDDDSSYADISGGAFTQVTTVLSLQAMILDLDKTKRYVRAVKDIGGTDSPAFPMSALLIGIKQVN